MRGFLFVSMLLLAGCAAPPEKNPAAIDSVAAIVIPSSDSVPKKIPAPPSLLAQSGFSWATFRDAYPVLLNIGFVIPGTWRDTSQGLLYERTLFNMDLRSKKDTALPGTATIVEFITWMPGKKILEWNELDKESLVSIRCRHACKDLQRFDLFGKDTSFITEYFGKADTVFPGGIVLLRGNELLRVFTKKKKIVSFYWMRLKERPASVAEIPAATLNFDRWSW